MRKDASPTAFIVKQIEIHHRQISEQSRGWFYFSLAAASIGLILISLGSKDTTSLAAIIVNAISMLFFAQSRMANKRADTIRSQLIETYKLQTYTKMIDSIIDPTLRDELRAKVIKTQITDPMAVSRRKK